MKYMLMQHADKHVVFLAMSVALVAQQYMRFLELSGMHPDGVGIFYGGRTPTNPHALQNLRVIFATPVVYQKMLESRQCFLHHCSLLVFDEVHHARKLHPYALLMKDYIMREKPFYRPRVFGMTASPGEGRDLAESLYSIEALCSTMNADITMPINSTSVEDLRLSTTLSETIIEIFDRSNVDTQLLVSISQFIKRSMQLLLDFDQSDRYPDGFSSTEEAKQIRLAVSAAYGNASAIQALEQNYNASMRTFNDKARLLADARLVYGCFSEKISENDFVIGDDLAPRLMTIMHYLHDITTQELPKKVIATILRSWETIEEIDAFGADSSLVSAGQLCETVSETILNSSHTPSQALLTLLRSWNQAKLELSKTTGMAQQALVGSGKVSVLMKYLNGYATNTTSRAIVFVQERSTAVKLTKFLQEKLPPSVGVEAIVGKSDMSSNNQLGAARRFNEGATRVLVATSVAEEGIDIQGCDLVVRLDGTTTSKSLIQSRGRARHKDSRYVLIVAPEDKEHLELLFKKEQFMIAAVRCRCDMEGLKREGVDIEKLFSEYQAMAALNGATTADDWNALHQYLQRRGAPPPRIDFVENESSSNARFTCTVFLNEKEFRASGPTKNEAKYKAASSAWNQINPSPSPTVSNTPHQTPPTTPGGTYPSGIPSFGSASAFAMASNNDSNFEPSQPNSLPGWCLPPNHQQTQQPPPRSFSPSSSNINHYSSVNNANNGNTSPSSIYHTTTTYGPPTASVTPQNARFSNESIDPPPFISSSSIKTEQRDAFSSQQNNTGNSAASNTGNSMANNTGNATSNMGNSMSLQSPQHAEPLPWYLASNPSAMSYMQQQTQTPQQQQQQGYNSRFNQTSPQTPSHGHASPSQQHQQTYHYQQHQYAQNNTHSQQQMASQRDFSPIQHQQAFSAPGSMQTFSQMPDNMSSRQHLANNTGFKAPLFVHVSRLSSHNPVGALQEVCQQHAISTPDYDDLGQDPATRDFIVVCKLQGLVAHGSGKQKKVAKTNAASAMLLALHQRNSVPQF